MSRRDQVPASLVPARTTGWRSGADALTLIERYHGPPVPIAPNDFVHLHLHSEFSLLDGLGRINDLVSEALGPRLRRPGDHRPRLAVRRGGLLPGLQGQGHQAHHRRRGLRGPPQHDRPRGQGRRAALPPRPAGQGLDGLPEPLPHHHRGAPRRLLLQAAPRPRAAGAATARASSACRPAWAARSPRPSRWTTGTSARRDHRRVRATSSARTASSSSSRTTACPSSAPSTPSSCASPQETGARARRHQRPALRPHGAARGARRAALRRHRLQPRHAQPAALRDPGVLPQDRRRDGAALPGRPGGAHEHRSASPT